MEYAWKNLSDAIFDHALSRPNAPALTEGGVTVTYSQFAALVSKASVFVHDLGVQPGEVVAVVMPNSIDHIVLTFALMRISAVPLDLPTQRPAGAFVDPVLHFRIGRVFLADGVPEYKGIICHQIGAEWRQTIAPLAGDRRVARDQDEMHFLSLTSGSTGVPKGIATTQRQWLARTRSAIKLFADVLTHDRPPNLLMAGGMGFSAFFFFLANQIAIGGPTVLLPETRDMAQFTQLLASWDDSVCLMTPPLLRVLLQQPKTEGRIFPRMRALFAGAAPLFPDEKLQIADRLCANFYEVYGSAATGFISTLAPADMRSHTGTVGRLASDVWLEASDGAGAVLPAGRAGHLRARGAGISGGLFQAPSGPTGDEGFRDGWYYPGDVGSIDDAGFITLKGRAGDMVRRNNVDIFMPEIEEVLQLHDSVVEAAAVGIPSTANGPDDRLVVFAVTADAVAPADAAAWCRARIPANKFPDRVYFVRGLPKTANGKIDKLQLRRLAIAGPGAPPA